ncbi:MAG: hypothetical protein COX07_07895 [Bacteroidetes bacterium CG23_combo_of_CG06-09_8_20_14_all_32_9]|nr:MAG: hypothetical protein COX07_07895 [Bacteroidetes bacterium CG23_combo_of_CG06-09_8_20_14_all_32_9]
MKNFIFLTLLLFISVACSSEKITDEKPIARVFNEFLYLSDLKDVLSGITSKDDSISLIKSFIEKWSKKQVLLHLAETNLSDEQKNVTRELDNYKTSLLIYKYQQSFISQKLDTVISEQELTEYYNAHPNEFQLEENIVKVIFIELPKSAPTPEKVKILYTSTKIKDLKKLDEYCNKYAFKYDDFKKKWISFNSLLEMIPTNITDQETFLKTNKQIEVADTNYYYFVNLKEFQLAGNPAPLEFAVKLITPIILTKRRIELLNNLENNALKTELNKKNVEIY